jgi:hypothetical protein
MQKSNFRDWSLDRIDQTFDTKPAPQMDSLTAWLAIDSPIENSEREYLQRLQRTLRIGGYDWNEVELENKLISPLIILAELDCYEYCYFLERDLEGTLGEHELTGRVDGMIASGFRSPKAPYFCLYEYKKEKEPNGDPAGQALIAMLIAQEKNKDDLPIYGSYIIGRNWYFMVLEGKSYTISNGYAAESDDIFAIFKAIKALKGMINQRILK